jgi:hypothetical protein
MERYKCFHYFSISLYRFIFWPSLLDLLSLSLCMLKRLVARFKRFKRMEYNTDSPQKDYRGFSTSITQLTDAQTDACSLACCGILQSDRDRYFVTGIEPPSTCRRVFTHVVSPLILFILACYGATHISNAYMNQLMSTMLIAFLLLMLVLQICFKARWKRVEVRKELLFRKYHHHIGTEDVPLPPEDDDELQPHYLQGQSSWDLCCAHSAIGCYRTDRVQQREAPKDLYEKLAQLFTSSCCCGYHLQVFGMCALAQEAREISLMIPAEQRRLDYVTMQHSLEYYAGKTLSQLSRKLLLLWVGIVLLLLGLGLALHFSLFHVLIFVTTFAHSWLLLWLVHGVWHSQDLSLDLAIKAFSCGFFLSVTLAVTWEYLVSIVLRVIMDILLAISGVKVAVDEDGYDWVGFGRLATAASRQDYMEQYGADHPFVFSILLFIKAFVVAAFIEELAKYLGYAMVLDHPDFWSRSELESAVKVKLEQHDTTGDSNEEDVEQETNQPPPDQQQTQALHDLLSTETKSNTRRGAAITITMVAVALGFACCENVVYIFVYNENSLNVGKSLRF